MRKNPYLDMEEESAKELRNKLTKENKDGWTTSKESGDMEKAASFHEREVENMKNWDEFTGNTSEYDEETGTWDVSKPGQAKNAEGFTEEENDFERGEESYRKRDFKYDVYEDPLYKQYLASAKRNGQNAMTDTMAKVASQTGGIAGSYAISAGAQSYNDYIDDVNDIIPELYDLAYEKYMDELERDYTIYEMDEAERWENAKTRTALQKAQKKGVSALTDEDKNYINLDGRYWIEGDKVKGSEGELASENEDDKKEKAREDTIVYDWQDKGVITDEDETFLRERGYWFDRNGNLLGPDGTNYATKGSYNEVLLAKYKNGENLTGEEKARLESAGEYFFDNGVLYNKSGEIIQKEYVLNDELQSAYNDYEARGWYDMDDINKTVLQAYGFKFDDLSGMIFKDNEYYRWGGATPFDRAMANYFAGNELEEDDLLMLYNKGYQFKDGVLFYDDVAIKRDYSGDEGIPADLSAAMSAVILSNQSGRALAAKYIDVLGKYGFQYNRSRGAWVHTVSGVTLFDYYK